MDFPNESIEEWVSTLKPYQVNNVKQLLAENEPEEAAKLYLSADGPSTTIKFGGVNESPEPFFERFKEEFKKFVCGDEAYEEFRSQLTVEGPVAKSIYVSVISAALGATFGYAATLLAPAVAIMLHLVGTMGINAWCEAS